jgi:hypothetical protein
MSYTKIPSAAFSSSSALTMKLLLTSVIFFILPIFAHVVSGADPEANPDAIADTSSNPDTPTRTLPSFDFEDFRPYPSRYTPSPTTSPIPAPAPSPRPSPPRSTSPYPVPPLHSSDCTLTSLGAACSKISSMSAWFNKWLVQGEYFTVTCRSDDAAGYGTTWLYLPTGNCWVPSRSVAAKCQGNLICLKSHEGSAYKVGRRVVYSKDYKQCS